MFSRGHDCCCDRTLRLFFCFFASFVLHFLVFVSGSVFPQSSSTAGKAANFRIDAVLFAVEPRSENDLLDERNEIEDYEALPSTSVEKKENHLPEKGDSEGGELVHETKQKGLVDSDRYYVRSELSQAPTVIDDVLLTAPPTKTGIAWSLRLRLYISESGFVDRLTVEESTAPVHVEEEAIKKFRSARYSPGSIHGKTVKSQLLILVTEPW